MAAAVAALAVAPVTASAAPNFDWAGPYLGVQGGISQAAFMATGTLDLDFGHLGSYSGSASKSYTGPLGHEFGVNAGYRLQGQQGFVFGAEADFNWTDLSATSSPLLDFGSCPWACAKLGTVKTSVDWYGTGRLVAGQAIGQLLLYGTGGFAYGNVASTVSGKVQFLNKTLFDKSASNSGVRWGWTAGAGAAIAINERVSAKLEYLHVDLSKKQIFGWQYKDVVSKTVSDDVNFDVVRAGLTVRFP